MKRNRAAEAVENLQDAEARLTESLLALLPQVVESAAPLFTNSTYNPYNFPGHKLWPPAQTVYEDALACVEARSALSLSLVGSVGQLFIATCEEAASSDEHRRGPRKLAAALLESLSRKT